MNTQIKSTTGLGYTGGEREGAVAEALARLAIATELRHTSAAARVLDQLTATESGAWLLVQMTAAGLRALSTGIQLTADVHFPPTLPPAHDVLTRGGFHA